MRFISQYGKFGVQVRAGIDETFANGASRVIQTPLWAMFRTGVLLPNEYEYALAHWSAWNGFYQMADEVTIVPPDYRIGVFDSLETQRDKGWSDEERIYVEEQLIANAKQTDNLLVIPSTLVAPPWPRYDDFPGDVSTLVQKLVDEGHTLADVLTYEQANQNRDELVDALETLIDDPDALLELQPEVVLG